AAAIREGRVPRSFRSPIAFVAGLLALLTILSAIFSRDPAVSSQHLPGLALLLLIPITMDLVDDGRRARALVLAVAAGAFAQSLVALWQFRHGGDDLENRIRG